MLTVVLYALAAIAIAAVIVVVLVVVLPDDTLAVAAADRTPTGLPNDRVIGADDLEQVRLPVGLRGYRMIETDAVIDRLVGELEQRDRTIAALRAQRDETAYQAARERTARETPPWTPPSPGDARVEAERYGAGRWAGAPDGSWTDTAAEPADIADAQRPSGAVDDLHRHPYAPPDRGTQPHRSPAGHEHARGDAGAADHVADDHVAADHGDLGSGDVGSADESGGDVRPGTTPAPQ